MLDVNRLVQQNPENIEHKIDSVNSVIETIDETERYIANEIGISGPELVAATDDALIYHAVETVNSANEDGLLDNKETIDIEDAVKAVVVQGALEEVGYKNTTSENIILTAEVSGLTDEVTTAIDNFHTQEAKLPTGEDVAMLAAMVIEEVQNSPGSNIEMLGYARELPAFSEQINDHVRTNLIKYHPSKKSEYGQVTETDSAVELSEHDALNVLHHFLKTEENDESISEALRHEAGAMAENLTFIGEKELNEGSKGLALYWKDYLDKDPDNKLLIMLMSDTSGNNMPGMTKSDVFLFDKILANFSDKDKEKYKDRLFRKSDDIRINPSDDKLKAIMLDDWSISGEQMRYAEDGVTIGDWSNERNIMPEINLLVGKAEQIKNGYSYTGDTAVSIKAYFLAHEDKKFTDSASIAIGQMGDYRITGFYSSVDYGFEVELEKMIQQSDKNLDMPPLTNIVRPYRLDGYVPENVNRFFGEVEEEREHEVIIPKGWTYLVHGTNKSRGWGNTLDDHEDIILTKDLSVITAEDREYSKTRYNRDTTETYSGMNRGDQVQIRVIFYPEDLSSRIVNEGLSNIKNSLTKDEQALIDKYYWRNDQYGRHPLVPRETKLKFVGESVDEYTGSPVYYYVPENVMDEYTRLS